MTRSAARVTLQADEPGLRIQHSAGVERGRIAMQVFLDSGQDGSQIGVEPVYPVLTPPLPLHKTAVQQARQVVGDTALFKTKLFADLTNVVRLGTEQMHNGEPRGIGECPEEFPIEAS